MTKKEINFSPELEKAIYDLEGKIRKEVDKGVFSNEEKAVMVDAYHTITGRLPSLNCSGCHDLMKKILINFFNLYPRKEVVVVVEKKKVKKTKK